MSLDAVRDVAPRVSKIQACPKLTSLFSVLSLRSLPTVHPVNPTRAVVGSYSTTLSRVRQSATRRKPITTGSETHLLSNLRFGSVLVTCQLIALYVKQLRQ